jgi:CHAT domain-containing protein
VAPFEVLEFLPSGRLAGLPFAALKNPRTGRYLVEDHAVAASPSASLYFASLEREQAEPRSDRAALAVGDPAFDVAEWPDLERLPRSAREAESVATLYLRHRLLLAELATRAAFAATAGQYEVVHFAGHNLKNLGDPLRSGLVFAGGPGGRADLLTAADIYAAHLERTRVVVLSACGTAVGSPAETDGAVGMAAPFLAAGVPAVVASLTDIADDKAAELLVRLHVGLAAGRGALSALHSAQLATLERWGHGAAAARRWAAFELIGSGTGQGRRSPAGQ